MALVASNPTNLPLSYSAGPIKVQHLNLAVASADVSGTVTADRLSSIVHAEVQGLVLTALPTFSGNVVTLAFVDPAATRYGSITIYGR